MQLMQKILPCFFVGALLLSASPAIADPPQWGYIYVTNCSDEPGNVWENVAVVSYNGKDGARLAGADSKGIGKGETKQLKCDGQGTGQCHGSVQFSTGKVGDAGWFLDVPFNQYIKVTGQKTYSRGFTSKPSC